MNRLLYYLPSWQGGLADYGVSQVNALVRRGVAAEIVAPGLLNREFDHGHVVYRTLRPKGPGTCSRSRIVERCDTAARIVYNIQALKRRIIDGGFRHVLLNAYSEYLAPLWAGSLRALERKGVVFGAVVHDPVRDFRVGPRWWHRKSIAAGYSFLHEAFVHEETELDTVTPMPKLRTTVIPHGIFQFPRPSKGRDEVRSHLRLPLEAPVVLSFGHIRDGKNLDLLIHAMTQLPSVYLLVAGREQSAGQKPLRFYQSLARSLNVEDRCRWIHRFVPDQEVGDLFVASDLVALTYSRRFRSASGVLNTAVHFRKPCLASSGGGNLRSVVEQYDLGWFVEPDELDALTTGLRGALERKIAPRWGAYEEQHSWSRNAELVCERMFGD